MTMPFFPISELALLGVAILAALGFGRLARELKLPSLLGYMLLGVLFGPAALHFFSKETLFRLSFVTEIALGFVAFTIGSELSLASLKRLGPGIVSIILLESFGAFLAVTGVLYLLTGDFPLSLVFGALAPASAPAATVAVIREYKTRGTLTTALYAVVGFDDGLAIVIFGFSFATVKFLLLQGTPAAAEGAWTVAAATLFEIGTSLSLGTLLGYGLCRLMTRLHSLGEILIVLFATILLGSGMAAQFHLSLILINMAVGFVLANFPKGALVHRARRVVRLRRVHASSCPGPARRPARRTQTRLHRRGAPRGLQ